MNLNISKVTGPPGTGKSTYLLRQILRACDRYFANRIGVVSFTNAAVKSIKEKIAEGSDETSDEVAKNVRTNHSHCFRLLGLSGDEIAETHIKEFNDAHPEYQINLGRMSNQDENECSFESSRQNDKLFSEMNILRNRLIPEEKWMPDVTLMWAKWHSWMTEAGYIDFTGMIEKAIENELMPDIDVLFVDECQDLTALQYKLIRQWSEKVNYTVFAGDSDQTIFRFSGAAPEAFINLEYSHRKHLDQSHRVPPAVHAYAEKIIKLAANRENLSYKPCIDNGDGMVLKCFEPDLTLPGTHMILTRCQYQLKGWMNYLMRSGVPWSNEYRSEDLTWNPMLTKSWIAARTYYELAAGKQVTTKALKIMTERVIAKGNMVRGAKKKIAALPKHDILNIRALRELGFSDEFSWFERPHTEVLKLTERIDIIIKEMMKGNINPLKQLSEESRVTVGTIHSVKGAEADHVWLDAGLSPLIFREMSENLISYYDEARVAYVAATRAKKTLGIMPVRGSWNPVLPQI